MCAKQVRLAVSGLAPLIPAVAFLISAAPAMAQWRNYWGYEVYPAYPPNGYPGYYSYPAYPAYPSYPTSTPRLRRPCRLLTMAALMRMARLAEKFMGQRGAAYLMVATTSNSASISISGLPPSC